MEAQGAIGVIGAKTNNLEDVSVRIPTGVVVAFTGVSGSGKTSLLLDTVHAEAQLRYLEGLAPFVRQFITPKDRPDVERITDLPLTLAVDQRRTAGSEGSTLGSTTALDAHLRLLFARIPPLAPEWDRAQGTTLRPAQFDVGSPDGCCATCHGAGGSVQVDPQRIIADERLPVLEGALGELTTSRVPELAAIPSLARHLDVDLTLPWSQQPSAFREAVLRGTGDELIPVHYTVRHKKSGADVDVRREQPLQGLLAEVERLHGGAKPGSAKNRWEPFVSYLPCSECEGTGIGRIARTVTLGGMNVAEVFDLTVAECGAWLERLPGKLQPAQRATTETIADRIAPRVRTMIRLGLDHLSLARPAASMSGGELQRARVTAQLSTDLAGVAYILDEPSAGLHPEDKLRMVELLDELRASGNSVLLIEHDPALIAACDWIVDIGPGAGRRGGRVVATGTPAEVGACPESVTGRSLHASHRVRRSGRLTVAGGALVVRNVDVNNVRITELKLPQQGLTCFTGVSGSGKSTLLAKIAEEVAAGLTAGDRESGSVAADESIRWLVVADQTPIGRTPRSNPSTYTKAFDAIRTLFASTTAAQERHLDASAFSFNSPGGRCETCAGHGRRQVDMRFMPDMWVTCDVCEGRRFTSDVLEVTFDGLCIDQVLELSADEAVERFADERVRSRLTPLQRVGLGYLTLGQSATQLSGGEAQRLKLATALARSGSGAGLVVLDEPTTGLHPSDIAVLVDCFDALIDAGAGVLVAEHNLELASGADWLVDLGPGSGADGGRVLFSGPPTDALDSEGPTAAHLRRIGAEPRAEQGAV